MGPLAGPEDPDKGAAGTNRYGGVAGGHVMQAARDEHRHFLATSETAERLVASVTPPVWDSRSPLRGRDHLVGELVEIAFAKVGATERRVWVLHGLGGCGKTAIAMEVANRARDGFVKAWWVRAADQSSLVAGMRAVARAAGASESELHYRHAGDVLWEQLNRLEEPWLLVIDNADDPSILAPDYGELADGTGWLRPVRRRGLVVATSRQRDPAAWGPWVNLQPVDGLPGSDGAGVLIDLVPNAGSLEDAQALSDRFEGLPLALRLAGSYLAKAKEPFPWGETTPGTVTTFAEFRAALDTRFAVLFTPSGADPDERRRRREDITLTWEMSLDLLSRRGVPEARPLLRLLACFGEAPIPLRELLDPATLARSPLFPGLTPQRLWQVLQELHGVRLVDLDLANGTAVLHFLVRSTNRAHPDIVGNVEPYQRLLVDLLNHAVADLHPDRPRDWSLWHALAPHCKSPLQLDHGLDGHPAGAIARLTLPAYRAARYLVATGLYTEAEAEYRRVLDVRRRALGDEHPDTLATRHWLAYAMQLRGNLTQAEDEYRFVLESQRRQLGEDDPATLETRRHLASLLQDRGRLDEAVAEYQDVLDRRERSLGDEHPDTLATRHALAYALQVRGDLVLAEAGYRQVIELQRRTLGDDHPDTLATRHNLAFVLQDRGRFDEAVAEYQAVFDRRERTLGHDHPDTLNTRHALAYLLQVRGELAQAENEYRQVIELQREKLDEDHPDTLGARHNLARVLQDQGHLDQAENEFQAVLELRRQVFGDDHRYTLATRHSLAYLLQVRGELPQAENEYREVIRLQRRTLPDDHPDVLGTRHNLAFVLQEQGHLEQAETEYRAVFDRRQQTLGDHHRDTLGTRHALAYVLQLRGELPKAEAEYCEVIRLQREKLGDRHPDTLGTRHNLAGLLHRRGERALAEAEYQTVLELRRQVLGETHEATLATRDALAGLQAEEERQVSSGSSTAQEPGEEGGQAQATRPSSEALARPGWRGTTRTV